MLIIGALLGLLAVAFGAYAEHGIHGIVSEKDFHSLMTALSVQQMHACVISMMGMMELSGTKLVQIPLFKWSGWSFIGGTTLFCLGIYTSIVLNIPLLLKLAPLGGGWIMIAWGMLLSLGVWAKIKKDNS